MNEERTYLDFVADMLDAVEKIGQFISGMDYEEFIANAKTVYAVIHGLEIIGEATKNLPDSVRSQYPDIPWRSIAGMRDKLIHSYFSINHETVWLTITTDLPGLQAVLQEILATSETDKAPSPPDEE